MFRSTDSLKTGIPDKIGNIGRPILVNRSTDRCFTVAFYLRVGILYLFIQYRSTVLEFRLTDIPVALLGIFKINYFKRDLISGTSVETSRRLWNSVTQ